MEIQKREQLKGMLINKFKLKYGNKPNISKYIDNEVQSLWDIQVFSRPSLSSHQEVCFCSVHQVPEKLSLPEPLPTLTL